ncbi:MAG TPA: Trk system potassium transporter TrkA [Candidatus Acetatifactor stercoripullorum]|uniref:Trk system potassium uptake protein TrkA n=1 Tax=Candidatus Acetatifactor stercoripullorum TaxID=2838414 RepID=A0A9D1UBB8_9FIRM|nr:Trk system potassium transporter TrkA [uncultured Acetatifactor sp.]HIW81552.1 Trk system potassium transporter TrkA [Candidatus Acetatifactor stercoripullorum]
MNIIIVGCGKVGYTLVEQLSGEDHNIVVIDEKEEKVKSITDELDAMGIVGNGVSYQVLQEAGITDTDLLIAVTGSDEQNLLCCVIAKKAGNCKTIARVRNPIYNEESNFLRKELGLAMIINPELTSASEIARIFQFPSAVKIDTFSKGRIELLHFRVTKECLLNNYELIHIRTTLKCEVLVCMVTRGEEVLIPKGDFVFQEGDIVAIISTPPRANEFFKKIGIGTGRIHSAMVVGGGTIAYYLAKRLLAVGIETKIIEQDSARCDQLNELLPRATVICGDGTDQKLLLQEGLSSMDGFAALTGMDEENILLSLFAKKTSSAKIVTKINRINFNSVLNDLKLDSITYPRLLTADTIIKYARSMNESLNSNVENLYKLEEGRAEALEFYIKETSLVTDTPLEKLSLRKNLLICCINRGGKFIIPGGQDELRVGDSVVVVLTHSRLNDIKDILEV